MNNLVDLVAHFNWSLALLCHPRHWFCFRLIGRIFIYLFIYVCFVKGSNAALQYVNILAKKK